MSYSATIAKIDSLEKHPNADKIQLAKVMGEQVVVGLNVQVGDVGIFFPVDGQLSHEFIVNHDLYNKSTVELLKIPTTSYGFFDKNRRVRAQTFRGSRSEGFWMPTSDSWLEEHGLSLGTSFTQINGIEICSKYITPGTRNAGGQNQSRSTRRGETPTFPKHYDTDQFRHKWEEISEGSIIYLTEKLHGTSGRTGMAYEDPEPSTFGGKIAKKLCTWCGYRSGYWTPLTGTRNVIVGQSVGNGFYGSDTFRLDAVKDIKLRKGEVIFYELVGDVSPGTPIMPECQVDKKELPDIYAQYGPVMKYRYGCKSGETRLYVYRIVQFNEDGEAVELSWPQVKKRCEKLGLNHVPEFGTDIPGPMFTWDNANRERCKEFIEQLSHGPSLLDPSHIREGVAIRIETPDGRIYSLKEKSFEFKFLEGIVKSKDSYIDVEEAA